MRLAVSGMVAFLVVLASCTTPQERKVAGDLEGQAFSDVQEVISWSGCQEWVGTYDVMPTTLEDRDALPLAITLANDPGSGIDADVMATTKVGVGVGAEDLVNGAMQEGQQVAFCTE